MSQTETPRTRKTYTPTETVLRHLCQMDPDALVELGKAFAEKKVRSAMLLVEGLTAGK